MLVTATQRAVRLWEAEGAQHGDLAHRAARAGSRQESPRVGDGEQLEEDALAEAPRAQVVRVEPTVDPVADIPVAPQDLPQLVGEGVELDGVHVAEAELRTGLWAGVAVAPPVDELRKTSRSKTARFSAESASAKISRCSSCQGSLSLG